MRLARLGFGGGSGVWSALVGGYVRWRGARGVGIGFMWFCYVVVRFLLVFNLLFVFVLFG